MHSQSTTHNDCNVLEEVALDTYNNDNAHHQRDQKIVLQEERRGHEADSRSAYSLKPESEKTILPPETVGDESPATYELIFITISLVLVVFCVTLDNTIVATAIPIITDYFHALDDAGWYGSAYLLTNCTFQLFFGKLYSFYSTKWVFLISLGIFEIGSLVCGAAPTSTALILGRAVAGLGGSGVLTGAFLVISQNVPLESRSIYTSAVASVSAVSSVLGPILGGIFTDHLSWRWCFYINLPFGGVTALFVFFLVKPSKQKITGVTSLRDLQKFDIPGTVVFLPGIVCLLLALQWGGSKYPWHSWHIIVAFVLGGLLICAFIIIQYWQQENATVPPRVIKNRNVWGSSVYNFNITSAMIVVVYYLPIWFQAIKDDSPSKSGVMNIPLFIAIVSTTLTTGFLVARFGYYTPFILAGSVLAGISSGLLSTLTVDSGPGAWIGYQIFLGISLGIGVQLCVIVVQTTLPNEDVPVGIAIVMFAQTLGGAVCLVIAQNIFQNRLVANFHTYDPNLDANKIISGGALEIRNIVSESALPEALFAYNKSIMQTFYLAVALGSISIFGAVFIEWKSVKRGEQKDAVAVVHA